MSILNNIKYQLPTLLLVVGSLCTSCTDEEMAGGGKGFKGEGLNLSISVTPLTEKVMTRAESSRTDRSLIERLDVVLAKDDDITKVINIDKNTPALQGSYDATATGLVNQTLPLDNPASLNLHIGTNDIQDATHVYIVANYIGESEGVVTPLPITDASTVSALKALKQGYPKTPAAQMVCTMFGELEVQTDAHNSHTTQEISLTRTLSMITLAIDGTDLNPGILITPMSVRLVNVPNSCVITGENTPNNTSGIAPQGHYFADLQNKWGSVANGSTTHEDKKQVAPLTTVADCHGADEQVTPLFMFENRQGTGSTGTQNNETTKTPPDGKDDFCSYIEILASYRYSQALGGTAQNIPDLTGNITYRFYLGENTTDNFNIIRNKHYMLTLDLNGWGGLVEDGVIVDGSYNEEGNDVSWRVETQFMNSGVVEDILEVPAGGSRVDITLVGNYQNAGNNVQIRYDAKGSKSNSVWVKESSGNGWIANPSTTQIPTVIFNNGDGTFTLKVYVKPLGHEEFEAIANGENDGSTELNTPELWMKHGYKDHKFTIDGKKQHSDLSDEFTIRQWLPMPVMVDDAGTPITSNDPRDAELYFSRFDIYHGKPLPWCDEAYFGIDLNPEGTNLITDTEQLGIIDHNNEGQNLAFNPNFGFHNNVAYFVTDREASPAFKGTDFNDGEPLSIMEYAIFESANAEPAEGGMFHETPDDVTTMDHYGLASVEEWVKIEKYGIIDPRYPLITGAVYWTSSIPPLEVGTSYIYMYGTNGAGKKPRNRSFKYPGRMVYHKKDKANFGTN